MRKCDGCSTEFDDTVQLYPRLVFTKEIRMARRLAAKEGEEQLCLGCWLESAENCDQRQLAMLILGMLGKISSLETRLQQALLGQHSRDLADIEKEWTPIPFVPYLSDKTDPCPVWVTSNEENRVVLRRAVDPRTSEGSYIAGMWSNAVYFH